MIRKAVITGATGFLGSALAGELLEHGVKVIGVGRNEARMKELETLGDFVPVYAELDQYRHLAEQIPDRDIDVFYHFAWAGGFTSAIRDYRLQMENAGFAGDAVMAAHEMNAGRFVYAGTYNQFEIEGFLETPGFEPRYTCIYATGKTAAGLICRTLAWQLGLPYTGGLVPMPYGENNFSMQLANVVILSLLKGEAPRLVEGNNLYDLVYIKDIARAFALLGEKGKNDHEYYVGHRQLMTFREWMIRIRDILAPEVELLFGQYEDRQQIDYSRIDLDALYRDTGFMCTADLEESIRSTAAWVNTALLERM